MSLECGLVGLPNVGKSTIFNILTKSSVQSANYPFCTIEPHSGITEFDDPRLSQIASLVRPEKIRKSFVKFIDIAGLVKDSHKGEGLGNQFLHHIREVNAIAHVLRVFDDDSITHVFGDVNPLRDFEIIQSELMLTDLQTVEKTLQKLQKEFRVKGSVNSDLIRQVEELKSGLESGKPASLFLTGDNKFDSYVRNLLTGKPFFIILNISEAELDDDVQVEKLKSIIRMFGEQETPVIPFCPSLEEMMRNMDEDERLRILEEYNMPMSGVDLTCLAVMKVLDLITFFTVGKKETASWLIKEGSTALQAAAKIHSDIAKNFIKAEVISFEDFISYGGEQNAKNAGKMRIEGKDYIVQDADIIHFRFNKAV